jgi:tRNA(fMet)-specific endonuclease VapC
MILFDSSTVIEILKNNAAVLAYLHTLPKEEKIGISAVSLAEVALGFVYFLSKDNAARQARFTALIQEKKITVFPLDEKVAYAYARLQAALLAEGQQLARFDGVIAATALVHNLPLVTHDRDFTRVKGLSLREVQDDAR